MPTDHPKMPVAVSLPYARSLAVGAAFAFTFVALMLFQAISGSPPAL
ncbi:MAG: hypothetical protein ACO1OK_07970 [Devosia sp.]